MSLKIYLDTSVISAYFDFQKPVRQLITQKWVQQNAKEFDLFASTLVLEEIDQNTDHELREKMLQLLNMLSISILEVNEVIFTLASVYREYILPQEINDTVHIAIASYYAIDAIVSWNFRHIVNLKTMKAIQEINIKQDYSTGCYGTDNRCQHPTICSVC
ncbi:PIN domain-containing protein [bacterium]|nr:PIN domain-containing protein [bacterium]